MTDSLVVRIACAFDEAYAPHFATLATSLAMSKGHESLHVTLIIGPDLCASTVGTLTNHLSSLGIAVECVEVPKVVQQSLPLAATYPSLIWYRLLLPDLLPHCERVLYLDADTLVLQSLLPLYMRELGTDLLGAVATPTIGWEAHCHAIGLESSNGYFNSGVLLMNLELMRAENFTATALQLAHSKNNSLRFPDQDLLNMVTKGRWTKLLPKWNAVSYLWLEPQAADGMYSQLEREVAACAPAIVHFEGPHSLKPWHFRSIHPARKIYRQMRATTPWPLQELVGRTWLAGLLRQLPLRWQFRITKLKSALRSYWRR